MGSIGMLNAATTVFPMHAHVLKRRSVITWVAGLIWNTQNCRLSHWLRENRPIWSIRRYILPRPVGKKEEATIRNRYEQRTVFVDPCSRWIIILISFFNSEFLCTKTEQRQNKQVPALIHYKTKGKSFHSVVDYGLV